jgi:hypothetical protein
MKNAGESRGFAFVLFGFFSGFATSCGRTRMLGGAASGTRAILAVLLRYR